MYDQGKIRWQKRLLITGVLILGFLLGFGLKSIGEPANTHNSTTSSKTTTTGSTSNKGFTSTDVKNFLIAYYTKKDLGENRDRYQPYMTDAAYQTETAAENQSDQQAYKGFVVDWGLDSSQIYIDQADHQAFVQVTYHNKQLTKKTDNRDQVPATTNQATLILNYAQENGKWLVNQIQHKKLTDLTSNDTTEDINSIRNGATQSNDQN